MGAPLRSLRATSWTLALAISFLFTSAYTASLPHVDDCYLCQKCHTGKPPGRRLLAKGQVFDPEEAWSSTLSAARSAGAAGGKAAAAAADGVSVEAAASLDGRTLLADRTGRSGSTTSSSKDEYYVPPDFKFDIMPVQDEIAVKTAKPNCTECYGCDTQLVPLQGVVTSALGQNMRTEVGASPEWLFLADLPDTAKTGRKAVIKVWCMPIDKVHGTFAWRCGSSTRGAMAVQFLVAQQKVMEECGLMDVTVKVWPAKVNAIIPGHGLHVWWDGLWMERADGLSLNQLSYKGSRSFVTGSLKTVMNDRLNHTRVVRAAMYDLLTSQCDRHSQNVFITDQGQIKLIDNLQALHFSWTNCAMDSIFLPGTQKNMVIKWGGNVAFKVRKARLRQSVNPMVVLDYRCYVKDGRIGTDYDPTLRKCLKKLSGMSAEEIQTAYGFPHLANAAILQQRASDMLNKGFEWTLRYGKPRRANPKSYRPQDPCCGLNATDKGQLFCSHEWRNTVELPYGDPMSGGEWRRAYPDPGTHEGGTFLDEPSEK